MYVEGLEAKIETRNEKTINMMSRIFYNNNVVHSVEVVKKKGEKTFYILRAEDVIKVKKLYRMAVEENSQE